MAGIYQCHFDDHKIRGLCSNISHSPHRRFKTWDAAWAHLVTFYPNLRHVGDLNWMNAHAPMESTNLNNPSPKNRKLFGTFPGGCLNLKARTYVDSLRRHSPPARQHPHE